MTARKPRKPPNDTILIIRLPVALRDVFAKVSYTRGKNMSEAVREAILEWIGQEESENTHGSKA